MVYIFQSLGKFLILIQAAFQRPEKSEIYLKETEQQFITLGILSAPIIIFISIFIGSVTTFQTAYQMTSGFFPNHLIGLITRDSTILELSPTISALILAGKLGSSIASEIGTMKVTEQLDAMEIMGINTKSFLILPRVIASVIIVPLLVILSIFFSLLGGYLSTIFSNSLTGAEYLEGLILNFDSYYLVVSMVKSFFFGFFIVTISSFQGFNVSGGSKEVGISSTKAVTFSCVVILLSDYIIAILML